MVKPANVILTRLENARDAIEEMELGKTEVMLDEVYLLKVTEKSFIFWDNKLGKKISSIPRFCEHRSTGNIVFCPDSQYINMITKYLSLPIV